MIWFSPFTARPFLGTFHLLKGKFSPVLVVLGNGNQFKIAEPVIGLDSVLVINGKELSLFSVKVVQESRSNNPVR